MNAVSTVPVVPTESAPRVAVALLPPAKEVARPHRSVGSATYPLAKEIAPDLLTTTPRQRIIALLRPFFAIALYAAVAYWHCWLLIPFVMFFLFISVVTVTHDIVHGALGLKRWQTEVALFVYGALVLESGHAYRATHLQHHRVFPAHDDIEGEPAHMPLWKTLVYGPLYLPRLWLWAFQHNRRHPVQRCWLLAEVCLAPALLGTGLVMGNRAPGVLLYAVLVVMGSWIYPLVTAKLQHSVEGDNALTHSATLRGKILPRLFLGLTYHLEHHLYPQVPSHHVAELSRRLDSVLREAGARPTQVF